MFVLAPFVWATSDISSLRAQFQLPDDRVDYADAKLAVDRIIDPSTDTAAVRRQLDQWEHAVRGMEHYGAKKDAESLMVVADLALAANPKDSVAMIWKANAYYLQIQQRYKAKYPNPADVPSEFHEDYRRLSNENLAWFAKAESLGWTQKTPEQEASFLQSIQRERANRG